MAASIILTNAGTNIPVFRQRSRTGGDGQSSSTPRISNGRWTSGCSRSSLREKRQKLWRVCAASTANTDIEDLKQAQVKLRQDEQELRRMTDAIPQAIVVQRPDGTPIYANQVTLEYTGLTLEDVQAEGFRERIFHPHDLERVREERQKALAIGEPFEIEQRTRRNDGQYRWFLIRYNPLRDDNGHVI